MNTIVLHSLETQIAKEGSPYIFGKVTTHDGDVYQGQIRWGKEEAFWFDFFNSSKPENKHLKWLSKEEMRALDKKDNNSSFASKYMSWDNNYDEHTHSFSCQFGDIKSLKILRRSKIILELKNGDIYKLKGGSNDIGAKINIYDEDLGVVKLDWDRVNMVEFMSGPANMESAFGEPLYGIVDTYDGSFTGYLQWDHEERLTKDELNGETEDGDMDIQFGKIKSIEKESRRRSLVTLNSGRTLELSGTNDVNSSNRGIIVNIPGYGRVDLQWDEFEKMTFTNTSAAKSISYSDFSGHKKIRGVVETKDGESYKGELVYDLDESYNLEVLNGIYNDIEYFIPFSVIESIKPRNREESVVRLTNGNEITFEGKVDVNEKNDGVLVFNSENDYSYIPWEEIQQISFNK